jgi:molybdenum-dependent DNA-binding transcriptional regulator ModE
MPRVQPGTSGEGTEHVTCRLCRWTFRTISASHLVRKHGFDPEHPIEEYKARFRVRRWRCSRTQAKLTRSIHAHLERVGRRWTRQRVIRELRDLWDRGEALNTAALRKRRLNLLEAAVRRFGSLARAVERAGIAYDQVRRNKVPSRENVLRELRALGGYRHESNLRESDSGLVAAARIRFGSWKAAMRTAGFGPPPPRPPRKWTREAILLALRDRAGRGLPLGYSLAQRDASGLVDAAVREFGGWPAARRAAGVSYRDPRHEIRRWTRQAILDALRGKADSDGVLHWSLAKRKLGGIEPAAIKEFGSIKAAIRAAGCRPPKLLHLKSAIVRLLREVRRRYGYVSADLVRQAERPGYDNPLSAVRRHFGGIGAAKAAIRARENASSTAAKARWARIRGMDPTRTTLT